MIGGPRGEPFIQLELRRISLHPNTIRTARESQAPPQTPVPGVGYRTVRKVKARVDLDVKIITAIRRALELHTGHVIDDQTRRRRSMSSLTMMYFPLLKSRSLFRSKGTPSLLHLRKTCHCCTLTAPVRLNSTAGCFRLPQKIGSFPQLGDYTSTLSRDKGAAAVIYLIQPISPKKSLNLYSFRQTPMLMSSRYISVKAWDGYIIFEILQ